ncbi:hypothetical protein [Streptomyces paradoxus]|uniref:hypothetical protein n=1 Tax=Streptomyces paradoxus TaxID=66375 RepID=UPI0038193888
MRAGQKGERVRAGDGQRVAQVAELVVRHPGRLGRPAGLEIRARPGLGVAVTGARAEDEP